MGIQESKLKMSTGNVPGIIPVSKYVKPIDSIEKLLKKKYILLLVSRLVLLR